MSKKIICLISFVLVLSIVESVVAFAPPEEQIPSNLTSVDIGNPLAGSSQYDSSTDAWTIRADGADIWDTSDSFRYAYKQLSGDGALVARVVQWSEGTNGWRKAGVMIRETLTPGSRHAMMIVTGDTGYGGGTSFEYRTTTDGTSDNTDYSHSPLTPYWVRIARSGSTITGSVSTDGTNWTTVGSWTATMPTTVYIGLCVTSHDGGAMATAVFDNGRNASSPSPSDGLAIDSNAVFLTWTPGNTAVSHEGFLSSNWADVNDRKPSASLGETPDAYYYVEGLAREIPYYWCVDEKDDGNNVYKGDIWSFTVMPLKAWSPTPLNGEAYAPPEEQIPSNLTSVDIGNPLAGSSQYDSSMDAWTIRADGADIWDTSDSFRYAYKQLSGDGALVARVVQWSEGTNGWRKAGVMIRETLTPGSRHAMMIVTGGGGGGTSFEYRTTTDGTSDNTDYSHSPLTPYWVRIARSGSTITGSVSADGTNWTTVGSVDTTMPTSVYIGLCVTSHDGGAMATAVFDNGRNASGPSPADGASIPETATYLTWTPGDTAVSHEGFLSSNWADVNDRNPSASLGTTSDPYYYPYYYVEGLAREIPYYWCVDEKDDGNNVYKGDIWSFTVMPLKAWSPSPPNGGAFVSRTPTLSWNKGAGTLASLVYFGTDATKLTWQNPPLIISHTPSDKLTFSWTMPTTLAYNTTYYWRIDQAIPKPGGGTMILTGDTWSFTTTITGLGTIRREVWTGLSTTDVTIGNLTSNPNYPNNPSSVDFPTSFECPVNWADGYGTRMQGWLYVGISGNYTFWIASDDNSELWLSTNYNPQYAQMIARVPGWTDSRQWYVYASQKSAPQYLVGGNRYYIMALQKEGIGGDNIAVAWQGPDQPYPPVAGQGDAIIPGSQLEPFVQYWAYNPNPVDGTDDVPLSGTLGWSAGWLAVSHDVYIGTNYSDVNTATTSSHPNVQYFSRSDTTCPIGPLSSGTVYYWRVDEVNNLHPDKLWKGQIWVFRTLGGGGGLLGTYYHWTGTAPPTNPFATLVLSRIDRTVDFDWGDGTAGTLGSPAPGIVNLDLFACKWIGSVNAPVAGSYTFYTATDDGQRLFIDGQLVINHWVDQGTTEYGSSPLNLTAGWHDIEMHQYENVGGAAAQLRWQGPIMTKQIIPAWYLSPPPLKASIPQPYDGDPEASPTVILSWRPGDKAAKLAGQDVYFGTDFNDVNEATTLSPSSIYRGRRDPNTYDPPETLELGQTYYWRVDEVNESNLWRGNIWSFRIPNTSSGDNVSVSPGAGTTLTFANVSSPGDTTVATSDSAPPLPEGFSMGEMGDPPIYYEINTTANYSPPITVCIQYNPLQYSNPSALQLLHYEGTDWVNVTTSNDTTNGLIYGSVMSLSPFAIALRINSPPEAQPAPSHQVVEIGIDSIVVIADVADFDGDTLSYDWRKGDVVLASGSIQTVQGGAKVAIPNLEIAAGDVRFPLGVHQIELKVSDGINEPVSVFVAVEVKDTTSPTLSPMPSVTLLWPPNHELQTVTIAANAFDNGGGTIHLEVTLESSEPPDKAGDGSTIPDYYIDSVDDATGIIQLRLRSERAGTGDGRTYKITITATDVSGNNSVAIVEIRAPHDRRKK